MEMKKCSKCKEEKPLSEFHNKKHYKSGKIGKVAQCKECIIKKVKEWYNNNKERALERHHNNYYKDLNLSRQKGKQYRKTHKFNVLLDNIKQRCNNPNNTRYDNYGGKGVKCLLTIEDLKMLWDRDNANNLKIPSIDRKDVDGNYEYDNCQFIEFDDNRIKDKYKPILQYDLQGNFIKEWSSAMQIEKELNISNKHIGTVCNGNRKSSGGFIWKHKEKNNG